MRRALIAVLLGAALMAAGCASSHRASAPVRRTNRTARSSFALTRAGRFWARQARLDAAANYAERVAGAAHVFAGVRVDDSANEVFVQLTHAPDAVIAQLHAAHPGIYVIRSGAPRTLDDVLAIQHSLDWSAWKAKGIDIVETFPQEGYLHVGVTSNVAKAQTLLDVAYGRGVVRVFHGEQVNYGCACGPTGPKR